MLKNKKSLFFLFKLNFYELHFYKALENGTILEQVFHLDICENLSIFPTFFLALF